jgi:ketosteroid isomerase-like protein
VDSITNADRVREGFGHFNERRFHEMLELFHEDVVWDMRPFGIPDMAEFHGHEGLMRFFEMWLEVFPDSKVTIEAVDETGDWTLSVVLQMVSGAEGGAPVPFRYGGLGHWRDGRLESVENFPDLDRAREAFERATAEARSGQQVL